MSTRLDVAPEIVALASRAYARGWVLGTSGNFSAVTQTDPLRLAITESGVDKGRLGSDQILEIDAEAKPVGEGKPSAESLLHLAVVRACGAGAVAHTHSTWSTLLSERHAAEGGLAIEGYEMLKGLAGVTTHAHREWLPIIENSQNWPREQAAVERKLKSSPGVHAFLIRRHGLYTWGKDVAETSRHLEILEFLLEAVARSEGSGRWQA
jgi:methylthioribulose-1-phosphate dehydratase